MISRSFVAQYCTKQIPVYKYLRCGKQRDEVRLFSAVHGDRARGNGHKLRHRKFRTHVCKISFMAKMMEHWNRLPIEAMVSPSLEKLKTYLDVYLCNLV